MEDKHPIDKVFRAGLGDPDIPFDERDWTALSRKMHPRKRLPLLIWMGSGIAAAVVIAAVLLFGEHDQSADHQTQANTVQPPPVVPHADPAIPRDTPQTRVLTEVPLPVAPRPTKGEPVAVGTSLPMKGPEPVLVTQVQTLRPTSVTSAFPANRSGTPRDVSLVRVSPSPTRVSPMDDRRSPTVAEIPRRGWILGIIAAPDLSGTGPLRGKLGGNIGLMSTYRLNARLSLTGGVLYAKKLYQTEFANYRASGYWSIPPRFVDADCNVLDIPLTINFDIIQRQRSTWFASAGASSYFMLSETYNYRYPPHEYGYPKRLTVRNENRHILGVGNVSVGYRRKLSPVLSITVQPFVKVPLTGIGNGNLKLYSSGVAISADIQLSPR